MHPTLIFDAHCSLCLFSKSMVERWDRRSAVRYLHYETPEAGRLSPDLIGCEHLDAVRFVDGAGKSWKGPDAVIHLFRILPLGRPLAWALTIPGAYQMAARLYEWVARNRYRWFGRSA